MYGVTTYLFSTKVELGGMISIFLGVCTVLIGISALITLVWKISVHAIGMGGMIGILMAINQVSYVFHFGYILIGARSGKYNFLTC